MSIETKDIKEADVNVYTFKRGTSGEEVFLGKHKMAIERLPFDITSRGSLSRELVEEDVMGWEPWIATIHGRRFILNYDYEGVELEVRIPKELVEKSRVESFNFGAL